MRQRHIHHTYCEHGCRAALSSDLVRIADIVRKRFRLEQRIAVRVQELPTTERGFPPLETRIRFWSGNEDEHQYRVFKPACEVTIEDLPPWWFKDALIVDVFPYCDCCG